MGNVTAGTGVLLILLAMRTLRKQGGLEEQRDFTETTIVVKQGVYSVVRHPLYLGWLLGYPAAMLVSQNWLVVIVGLIGMVSMVQITRRADSELIAKFGPEYENYMREVPQRLAARWLAFTGTLATDTKVPPGFGAGDHELVIIAWPILTSEDIETWANLPTGKAGRRAKRELYKRCLLRLVEHGLNHPKGPMLLTLADLGLTLRLSTVKVSKYLSELR